MSSGQIALSCCSHALACEQANTIKKMYLVSISYIETLTLGNQAVEFPA